MSQRTKHVTIPALDHDHASGFGLASHLVWDHGYGQVWFKAHESDRQKEHRIAHRDSSGIDGGEVVG